jgi:plasmid stabilization system protein ParE
VLWAPEASLDLDDIILSIAEDHPQNAIDTMERLQKKAKSLEKSPKKGVPVPELKLFGVMSYQQIIEEPWKIIYRISNTKVYILAVIHLKRDIEQFLLKRLTR